MALGSFHYRRINGLRILGLANGEMENNRKSEKQNVRK